jgi:hypothetical protein
MIGSMELSETAWRWIAGAGTVALIAAVQLQRAWKERRRRAWFGGLADAFGASPTHDAFKQSHLETVVASRRVEIAHRVDPMSSTRRGVPRSTLIVSTPLRAVSDIHSFRLQRRKKDVVVVERFGFEPREGWMSAAVREKLTLFFEIVDRADTLDIEEGHLRFRTSHRYDPATLGTLVDRQVAAAEVIERAL